MDQLFAPPREMWHKPACLLVSVILNVGLGLLCLQSFRDFSSDDQPIIVTLVTRSTPAPEKSPARASVPRTPKPATALRQGPPAPVSAPRPVTVPQPEAPRDTLPVAEDADIRLPGDVSENDPGSPLGVGGEEGWDTGRSGGRTGQGNTDRLIKATPREEFNATPNYPDLARESRWEGTVRVRARVTAAGMVESVSLERSSGHAMLDRSALDSVQQWRFIPALRNGVPVASEVSVQIPFHLSK